MAESRRNDREFLLLSVDDPSDFTLSPLAQEGRTLVIPGTNGLSAACLALSGIRGRVARVGGLDLILPDHPKAAIIEDGSTGRWRHLYDHSDVEGTVRLFLCRGKSSRLGIRTSVDWDRTFWGTRLLSRSDYWFVCCSLPAGHLEYKLVTESGDSLEWEPEPFCNKELILTDTPQIIFSEWEDSTSTIIDVPLHRKLQTVSVSVSADITSLLTQTSGSSLVLTNPKDQDNHSITGHHVLLSWSECYQTFATTLSLPGHVTKLKFGLAIMDDLGVITHLAERCYYPDNANRYFELICGEQDNVTCETFIDVRPHHWQTDQTITSPISPPLASLYNRLRHSPLSPPPAIQSPGSFPAEVRMSLYKDLVLAASEPDKAPSPSQSKAPGRKTSSLTRSLTRVLSWRSKKRKQKRESVSSEELD